MLGYMGINFALAYGARRAGAGGFFAFRSRRRAARLERIRDTLQDRIYRHYNLGTCPLDPGPEICAYQYRYVCISIIRMIMVLGSPTYNTIHTPTPDATTAAPRPAYTGHISTLPGPGGGAYSSRRTCVHMDACEVGSGRLHGQL